MRHKADTATLREIINSIDAHSDEPWYDVMGIDLAEESESEAAYLQEHEQDEYEIHWPEHVVTPRYNSDAIFQPVRR